MMKKIWALFFLASIVILSTACLAKPTPNPIQPETPDNPVPKNSTATSPAIQKSPTTTAQEASIFSVGINECSLGSDSPSGWKTYYCSFWIQSSVIKKLSDFPGYEGEGSGDSRVSSLKSHDTNASGIYVTTDADVNYPVDVGYTDMWIDQHIDLRPGLPVNKYVVSEEPGHKEIVKFFFYFMIPESMSPNSIILPIGEINLEIPPLDTWSNPPELTRNISAELPSSFELSLPVAITVDEVTFSYNNNNDNILLNLNTLIKNLDKTSQQSGVLDFIYYLYDSENAYYWKNVQPSIQWDLAPDQSISTAESYTTSFIPLPEYLYLIPTNDNSNTAIQIETKSVRVTNCEAKNQEDMAIIDSLDASSQGTFEYWVTIPAASQSYIYSVKLPSRKMITITYTGSIYAGTIDTQYILPDGTKMITPNNQSEPDENNYVELEETFYSLCETPIYLSFSNSSSGEVNIKISITSN